MDDPKEKPSWGQWGTKTKKCRTCPAMLYERSSLTVCETCIDRAVARLPKSPKLMPKEANDPSIHL